MKILYFICSFNIFLNYHACKYLITKYLINLEINMYSILAVKNQFYKEILIQNTTFKNNV